MSRIDELVTALASIVEVNLKGSKPRIVNYAPDSREPEYGGNTEPGSPWDEECDRLLAEIEAALPDGWRAYWSDNDICFVDEDEVTRSYTIFDADPATSCGCAWSAHHGVEIGSDEAATMEEAIQYVQYVLDEECAGLSIAEGYEVGQTIYAYVWDLDDTITTIEHELTPEDLGVEESGVVA